MSSRVLGRTGSINERKALGALDALGLEKEQEARGLLQYARRAQLLDRWIAKLTILEAHVRDRDPVVGDAFGICRCHARPAHTG